MEPAPERGAAERGAARSSAAADVAPAASAPAADTPAATAASEPPAPGASATPCGEARAPGLGAAPASAGPASAPALSVVIPMRNEADGLGRLYERLAGALAPLGLDWELVAVDDGSTDATLARLLELRAEDPRVKVVELTRNFGKEVALTAGLDHARGEAVIPLDADLQDPPEVIAELVRVWREGYDVVYATRRERSGDSLAKRATAALFYRAIGWLADIPIPANTGDFRLLSRRVVEALGAVRERHRFMKGLFAWVGFRQAQVLYDREPRHAGETKWNYRRLVGLAVEGVTSFSTVPLRLATVLGLAVAACAFLYGAFILIRTLLYGNPVPGYPSLLVIMLFLGGVQLLTIGILGEYIGRIYAESKQRPLYLVRSAHGVAARPLEPASPRSQA